MTALFGLLVLICGCGDSSNSQRDKAAQVQSDLQALFAGIDADLTAASEAVALSGIDQDASRGAVGAVCRDRSYAIDCATIDTRGIMKLVEPEPYREYEGSDISSQAAVQKMLGTHAPVFSGMFDTVEGIRALDIQHPVFSAASGFLGSLSLLLHPEALCGSVIDPLLAGTQYKAWVMQLDGLILYETDPSQIGLNLFTAPLYQDYPELIALGQRIAAEPEGAGFYTFLIHGTPQVIRKKAVWRTVTLYDGIWRVVIYRQED